MGTRRPTLRRRMLHWRLGLSERGRCVRELLWSPLPLDRQVVAAAGDPGIRALFRATIAGGAIRNGDLARRIRTISANGDEKLAETMLATALDALPEALPLLALKLDRMAAQGRSDDVEALAVKLIGQSEDLTASALSGLVRAGFGDLHPLVLQACDELVADPSDGTARADAMRRIYAALGLPNYAKMASRDGASDLEHPIHTLAEAARPADPFGAAFDVIEGDRGGAYEPQDRLLLLGNSLGCGGMERVLAQTYRHYAASGAFAVVDLALLSFAEGEPTAHYREEAGIDAADIVLIDPISPESAVAKALPPGVGRRAERLYQHIRATRPRVIHAWNDITGIIAAFAGLAAGCPKIVIHFHHSPAMPLANKTDHPAYMPAVYRRFLKRPEIRTIFCAEMAARGYARWWSLPFDERFRVLRNGFVWSAPPPTSEARERLGLPIDVPIVGTVTRFDPVKQMGRWAEAAIAFAKYSSSTHFLLVGDGPERAEVTAAFEAAGLAGRTHFAGRQEHTEDYYAAMDVLWMTSSSEGLPTVCIEAAAAGVPVVSFDVGGVSETMVDGETGLLVPPDDVDALVAGSAELFADPARLADYGEAGRRFARSEFSQSAYVDALTKVYGD